MRGTRARIAARADPNQHLGHESSLAFASKVAVHAFADFIMATGQQVPVHVEGGLGLGMTHELLDRLRVSIAPDAVPRVRRDQPARASKAQRGRRLRERPPRQGRAERSIPSASRKPTVPVIGDGSRGGGIITSPPRSRAARRAASAEPSKSMSLLATTRISPAGSAKRALQNASACPPTKTIWADSLKGVRSREPARLPRREEAAWPPASSGQTTRRAQIDARAFGKRSKDLVLPLHLLHSLDSSLQGSAIRSPRRAF